MNFILPADMPVVFHDFVQGPTEGGEDGGKEGETALVYAGNLQQEFDPSSVYISSRSGRLYHPLNTTKKRRLAAAAAAGREGREGERDGGRGGGRPRFGLVRSHVGLLLSDRLVHTEEDEGGLVLMWGRVGGKEDRNDGEEEGFIVRMLPEEDEPVWGMPPY